MDMTDLGIATDTEKQCEITWQESLQRWLVRLPDTHPQSCFKGCFRSLDEAIEQARQHLTEHYDVIVCRYTTSNGTVRERYIF